MTQPTPSFPPGTTFPHVAGPPAPSVRNRAVGLRAVAGVALATVVLGGLGGVLLGRVSADAGGQSGPGGGPGGFGTSQRGGFGGQPGQNGFGQQGQPGQPPVAPGQSAVLPGQSGTTTSRSVARR